jgi:hypothetical protein
MPLSVHTLNIGIVVLTLGSISTVLTHAYSGTATDQKSGGRTSARTITAAQCRSGQGSDGSSDHGAADSIIVG